MNKTITTTLAALALFTTTGCDALHTVSSPPPMSAAELDISEENVKLSKGVALAITCIDPWTGFPCKNVKITSDDPEIAIVSFAHLDKYRSPSGYVHNGDRKRATFIIAGVGKGRTTVRMKSDDADRILEVEVQ